MILDERNEFADATALSTAGTGRALVGDVIDLVKARNVGNGSPLYLVIQVTTAPTSGGAATLDFEFVSDAQAALATDGTATKHGDAFGALTAIASFTVGKTFIILVPPQGAKPYERFIGILQNVGTAALTAGAINAFLTHDIKQWVALDDGQ